MKSIGTGNFVEVFVGGFKTWENVDKRETWIKREIFQKRM